MNAYVVIECPYCRSKNVVESSILVKFPEATIEEDYFCKDCKHFFFDEDLEVIEVPTCINCGSSNLCIDEKENALVTECVDCGEITLIDY
jgi:transposase-like protein